MYPEQYNPEQEKQFIQNRIFEILDRKPEEIKKPEKFEIQATIPVEKEKLNWHDNFLALMEPKIKNKKILDLFCGSNSIKRYFQEKKIPGEVIGIDNTTKQADIKADVAEIEKVLPAEKQFDIICSFGGVPGVINYEKIKNYLKDDGYFITQSSDQIFYENILPVLENKEKTDLSDFSLETKKNIEQFQPVVIIEMQGVKDFTSNKPSNDVYIIYKK